MEKLKTYRSTLYVSSPTPFKGYILLSYRLKNKYALYEVNEFMFFLNKKIDNSLVDDFFGCDVYVIFTKQYGQDDIMSPSEQTVQNSFETEFLVISGMKQNILFRNDELSNTIADYVKTATIVSIVVIIVVILIVIICCCFCCKRKDKKKTKKKTKLNTSNGSQKTIEEVPMNQNVNNQPNYNPQMFNYPNMSGNQQRSSNNQPVPHQQFNFVNPNAQFNLRASTNQEPTYPHNNGQPQYNPSYFNQQMMNPNNNMNNMNYENRFNQQPLPQHPQHNPYPLTNQFNMTPNTNEPVPKNSNAQNDLPLFEVNINDAPEYGNQK